MRLAFTLICVAAMLAGSVVVCAWTVEQLKRMRGQHITAQAALRRRMDRELDAIRAGIVEELDRLWGHVHENVMPAPAGPATEPADQVLIAHWAQDLPHPVDSDDRKAQHEAWVDETLARFDFSGRNR